MRRVRAVFHLDTKTPQGNKEQSMTEPFKAERLRELVESLRRYADPDDRHKAANLLSLQAERIEKLREALDMAAFRMQMLVNRMPPDEDGRTAKALAQITPATCQPASTKPMINTIRRKVFPTSIEATTGNRPKVISIALEVPTSAWIMSAPP